MTMALNPMMTEEEELEPVDMSEPTDDDNQAMLDELNAASEAGEDFEAKSSFEDVPGTDTPVEPDGDEGMDEERLRALLAQMGG